MINLNKVLSGIIFLLLVIIISGTILGLFVFKHKPGENLRASDPSPKQAVKMNHFGSEKTAAYTELGNIRCVTKPEGKEEGITLVVTPWLSYPDGDNILFEELSRKRLVIKTIFTNYFSSYTEKELLQKGENRIKTELLMQINQQMSLGKISSVYFSDYIFLK